MSRADGFIVWLSLAAKAVSGALFGALLALMVVPTPESWWTWVIVAPAAVIGAWFALRYCDDLWRWLREILTERGPI